MKKTLITIGAIILAYSRVHSQGFTLRAGDTFTYQFNTLPLQGGHSDPPLSAAGKLDALFGSFAPGGTVLCEMFENSTAEAAIASQTLSSTAGYPAPPGASFWSVGAWQDLQGAIRFTMVSGSVTITSFRVMAIRDEATGLTEYSSTIVPEPEALPLLCALVGIAVMRRKSH